MFSFVAVAWRSSTARCPRHKWRWPESGRLVAFETYGSSTPDKRYILQSVGPHRGRGHDVEAPG